MSSSLPEVIGKYRIERFLESGGMGDVFLARDPVLDRLVAIKFLREGFDNEEMRERFEREARAAGRLSHPNIVTIYEFGECDRRPFIAMEFVRGEPLSKRIRRRETMATVRKLELMEGLCAGLAHAHKAGIVHRDIKPANLMVDADAPLKILDFGIVRMAGSGLTSHGVLVGTVNYMSPEQISGIGTIDHRSDVFAVGAVMHELFTYQRAFAGEMTDVLYQIVHDKPESAAALMPGLDPAIVRAIDLCLDKSPDRRYQDLALLRRDLARIRHRLELEDPETHGHSVGHSAAARALKTAPIVVPAAPGRPARDEAAERRRVEAGRLQKARAEEAERARLAREQADRALQEEARRAREEAQRLEAEQAARAAAERRAEAQRQQAAEQARLEAERRAHAAVEPQLASARELFAREDFTAASRIVQGVLHRLPQHPGARALELDIVRGVELRAKAGHVVARARQAFETRPGDALDALRRFTPPHPLVASTLAELEARQQAAERARREQARRERRRAIVAQAASLARRRPVQIAAAAIVALLVIAMLWSAMRSDEPASDTPVAAQRELPPSASEAGRMGLAPSAGAARDGAEARPVPRRSEPPASEPTRDEGNARIDDAPLPAPAAADPRAVATTEIQAWVDDYTRAFRALDERRVKTMYPKAPMNRSMLRSADVQFTNVSIEAARDGRSAWLRADVKYDYTWKRPGLPEANTQSVVWPMRKTGTAWVVD